MILSAYCKRIDRIVRIFSFDIGRDVAEIDEILLQKGWFVFQEVSLDELDDVRQHKTTAEYINRCIQYELGKMNKAKSKLKNRIRKLEKELKAAKTIDSKTTRILFEVTLKGNEISILPNPSLPSQMVRSYITEAEWMQVVEPASYKVQATILNKEHKAAFDEQRPMKNVAIQPRDLLPAWKQHMCRKVCKQLNNAIEKTFVGHNE